MQDSPKRPRMNIETPKSTNCSSEKRLDRYEDTPEKTPDRIVKTPFRSQEKRLKQETIEQGNLLKLPFLTIMKNEIRYFLIQKLIGLNSKVYFC